MLGSSGRAVLLLAVTSLAGCGLPDEAQAAKSCTRMIDAVPSGQRGELARAMTQPGEGLPANVNPYMNWREHGRVGQGNKGAGFGAFVPWGQVFAAEGQKDAAPATIAVRRMRAYILSRSTGRWNEVSASNSFEGALFKPNFEGNSTIATRVAPGADYTVVEVDPQRPFHFWPKSGRVAIAGADVGGVLVSYQVRIIDQGASNTRYLFSAGGDYWKAKNSTWDNLKTNGDAGIGRFVYATSRWRTAFMTTSSQADLERCLG